MTGVVVAPVLLPPPRSASALAEAMVATTDQSTVRRRWGLVMTINGDGTVNVDLAGVEIPNLRVVAGYQPTVGERVILDVVGTDMTVLGATGQSPRRFNRPTGDIEPTIRKTAKPDTLILNGQTVSRTIYARLFAWVQQEGLLTTAQAPNNLFGVGDGSTTFTLPDFRGRTVVGATDALPLGSKFGADNVTLATAQMPAHKHSVTATGSTDSQGSHTHDGSTGNQGSHTHTGSTGNQGSHSHTGTTGNQGDHANHHGVSVVVQGGSGATVTGFVPRNSGGHTHGLAVDSAGGHTHGLAVDSAGGHTHGITTVAAGNHTHNVTTTVTEQTIGGTTPVDVRQPSYAINWLIWV